MPATGGPPIADSDEDPNAELRPYASPPCYAHEVDPAYFGLPSPGDPPLRELLKRALADAAAAIAAIETACDRL